MSACWLAAMLAVAAPDELPEYPRAALVRIGGDLAVAGGLYRMGYFVTGDPIAVVSDYFLATWDRQGLPTTADGDFAAEAVVSAFRTREGIQLAVVLVALERGTLGISVVRDLWADVDPAGGAKPAGAGRALERETARAVDGDAAGAARLVSEELSAKGFRLLREERRGRSVVLEHERAGERQLSLVAPSGSRSAVLQSASREIETEEGSR